MRYQGSFPIDANYKPDTAHGALSTTTHSLTGNNTTIHDPIFTVVGSIEVLGLWGIITTVIGANHTAAYWRVNDGTNTPAITVSTGTTLSTKGVGSVIVKKGLAAAALVLLDSAAAVVSEPTTLETTYFSPFVINANNTATSNIEYNYTTTDTPTSGAIQFFLRWIPLSVNANVIAL